MDGLRDSRRKKEIHKKGGRGRRRKREDHIILIEMTRDDGDGEVFFL